MFMTTGMTSPNFNIAGFFKIIMVRKTLQHFFGLTQELNPRPLDRQSD